MTPSQVNDLLTGRYQVGPGTREKLAALGCDVEWLMTGKGASQLREPAALYMTMMDVPVVGRVLATPEGKQYFADLPEGVSVPYFKGPYFALVVENDSLIDAPEGERSMPVYPNDIVVFDSSRQPHNGDIVAVQMKQSDNRMIKVLRHASKSEVELISFNKFRNYPAVKVKKSMIASYGVFVTILKLSRAERRRLGI